MALNVGDRLGHYDVTALIGEGGMGQVYRATDTQLHRDVALKILPDAFAADPDRLARFKREAQILASLNHPNIAQIHGIEEAEGTRALVLELVEGPTLADRIAKGPIPLDEALPIAKQIAEALEAAHEAGVIHRDLKPANINVRVRQHRHDCGQQQIQLDREDSMNKKVMRLAASFAVIYSALTGVQAWGQGLSIEVLSSFPELVTGGDALVRITGASTAPNVTVGGRDVSAAFVSDGSGGWIGLVDGLVGGDNALAVSAGGGQATLTLTDYPINGTLFAGPQQTPFVCENDTHGLAPATDESCAAPTISGYNYRSTDGTWKRFDPSGPRATDIAMTTTMDGKTVPLITWYEKGIINRSAYVISLLHDPAAGPLPTPVSNETGWNGKLILSHRGGVRAGFHQGRTIGTLDPERGYVGGENNNLHESLIRAGYAMAGGSLMVTATTTNHVVQAETSAKIKERFIELFGLPKFTISMGTSGGSMSQHLIAQTYPGLYDAILPWRSYSDVLTFQTPLNDCNLLAHYFKGTDMPWTDLQKREVSGKLTYRFCTGPAMSFPNLSPANCDSSVLDAKTFEPEKWKDVRCTYQDNLVNVYGIDPETGRARSPWDNVGVQYGLQAFNDGIISFDQFAELNARIGGHDGSGVIVPGQRSRANPDAVRIAYETGRLNTGQGGLRNIPILDVRGYTDGICTVAPCPPRDPTDVDVHDGYHTLVARARLLKANGNIDNHVRIVTHEVGHRGPDSILGIVSPRAVAQVDKWLTDVLADASDMPQAQKVAAHRPADFVDACYTAADAKITNMDRCAELFPIASDARIVAGAPAANDVLKCTLKPVDANDYSVSVSATQRGVLQRIFPEGVCDWSRPGVGQVPLAGTWAFYTGNAEVRYLRSATLEQRSQASQR